jgi:hypothetical protein
MLCPLEFRRHNISSKDPIADLPYAGKDLDSCYDIGARTGCLLEQRRTSSPRRAESWNGEGRHGRDPARRRPMKIRHVRLPLPNRKYERPDGRPRAKLVAPASATTDPAQSRSYHTKCRIQDVFVSAAATDIAGDRLRERRTIGRPPADGAHQRHNHTRSTEPAL